MSNLGGGGLGGGATPDDPPKAPPHGDACKPPLSFPLDATEISELVAVIMGPGAVEEDWRAAGEALKLSPLGGSGGGRGARRFERRLIASLFNNPSVP